LAEAIAHAGAARSDSKYPRAHPRVHQQRSAYSTFGNSQTRNHHQSSLSGAPCNFGTNIIIVIIVIDANSGPARSSNSSLTRRPIDHAQRRGKERMKNFLKNSPPLLRRKFQK